MQSDDGRWHQLLNDTKVSFKKMHEKSFMSQSSIVFQDCNQKLKIDSCIRPIELPGDERHRHGHHEPDSRYVGPLGWTDCGVSDVLAGCVFSKQRSFPFDVQF
jgi:hypothetical protein